MPKPYKTIDPLAKSFIAAGLEAGLDYSTAVRLGIDTLKEVDLLVRTKTEILSPAAITDIHLYAISVIRSGSTLNPFNIAVSAVATWREAVKALRDLHYHWQHQRVDARERERQERELARASEEKWDIRDNDSGVPPFGSEDPGTPSDFASLYADFRELKRFDLVED